MRRDVCIARAMRKRFINNHMKRNLTGTAIATAIIMNSRYLAKRISSAWLADVCYPQHTPLMSASDNAVIYHLTDHIGTLKTSVDRCGRCRNRHHRVSHPHTHRLRHTPGHEIASLAMLVVWLGVWTLYFVVLKGSRFRTVGYVLAGARIVNLERSTTWLSSL